MTSIAGSSARAAATNAARSEGTGVESPVLTAEAKDADFNCWTADDNCGCPMRWAQRADGGVPAGMLGVAACAIRTPASLDRKAENADEADIAACCGCSVAGHVLLPWSC